MTVPSLTLPTKVGPNVPGNSGPQIEENCRSTKTRGDPRTAGGRAEQLTVLPEVTTTFVKLLAVLLPAVQLSVNVTVCGVLGIVTDNEPEAGEEPLHPPVRVQVGVTALPTPSVNPVVDQVTVVAPFTLTELSDALIDTTGVPAGAAVLTVATPVSGSIATALSELLDVSGRG